MTNTQPATARIWQYSKTKGGLENHLQLNRAPVPTPKPNQHLIRVIATALNPVDYKLAETPILGGFLASKPATPGLDISGEIVIPAAGSPLKRGQLVLGASDGGLPTGGGLAEYAVANKDQVVKIPANVSPVDAASIPVSAVTSYQALTPNVKQGDRVFINGGSGGVGVIAIQVAKILGCHVTVSCSTRNVELCRSLGADEVVDYTKTDVVSALNAFGNKFDLVLDGVGTYSLYWKCDQFTKPGAKFIYIAFSPTPRNIWFLLMANVLPSFLGGQKRELVALFSEFKVEHMQQVADWMEEGKVKVCIDSRYPMEQAPEAFRKLKTSRARGKVLVEVAPVEELRQSF